MHNGWSARQNANCAGQFPKEPVEIYSMLVARHTKEPKVWASMRKQAADTVVGTETLRSPVSVAVVRLAYYAGRRIGWRCKAEPPHSIERLKQRRQMVDRLGSP